MVMMHEVADRLGGDGIESVLCEERLMGRDDDVGKRQEPGEDVVTDDGAATVVEEQVGLLFVDIESKMAEVT